MGASTYKWDSTGISAVAAEGGDPGNWMKGKNVDPEGKKTAFSRYIDLTACTAASAVAYKIATIPAGAFVTRVQVVGTTGENLNLSVGDAAAGTTFLSAASQSTAAVQTAWSTGKRYASADEINMTWSNSASNFKGYVYVEFAMMASTGN